MVYVYVTEESVFTMRGSVELHGSGSFFQGGTLNQKLESNIKNTFSIYLRCL